MEIQGWSAVTELLNIVAMAGTAVWAVSKIKGTTEKLGITMDHLRSTVERLDVRFERTASELVALKERVTVMEVKQNLKNRQSCHLTPQSVSQDSDLD